MKCIGCRRSIASGIEAQRMVCEYLQPDGTTKLFGLQMPDGPISAATGQLMHGWHSRCYHAQRKRKARAESVSGSAELAARAALRRTVEAREADPGHVEPVTSDWREQTQADM